MYKIVSIVLILLFLQACKVPSQQNYVRLSGNITNNESDVIKISNDKNELIKEIKVAVDGAFSDTLHIAKGNYIFSYGGEYAKLFINQNSNLVITLDTDQFDESLHFTGKGSGENNYTVQKLLQQEAFFEDSDKLYKLPKEAFIKKLDSIRGVFETDLASHKEFDASFVESNTKDTKMLFGYFASRYDAVVKMNKLIGKPTPKFSNYENYDGSTTSMDDLKGKYIYIDVWATWCRPCLAEISALKELEKELGDKLYFVSISVDKDNKHEAWKKMVSDKELKGIQLFAAKNWKSQFIQDFGINSIPRFILIDPQGNVVNPNASRPSDVKTAALLRKLVN